MENEHENLDSQNEEEVEVELEVDTEEESAEEDESVDDDAEDVETIKRERDALKKENSTLKFQKKHFKDKTKEKAKTESFDLTPLDAITISKSNTHEDDIETVLEWARFRKVPVKDALRDEDLRAILEKREQFRKTAEATSTGKAKKSIHKVTPDVLVKELSEGKIPEKGSSDAEELFWAKRGGRRE